MADSTAPRTVDMVVTNGHVLTMDDSGTIIRDGSIAVDGGRIVGLGSDPDMRREYRGRAAIDARGGIVHPGLIESHVHASYHLVRGLIPDSAPADLVFETFERPFYNVVRDKEEYLGVKLASLEMLRNGTTCFLEAGTVLEPSAAAQAAEDVGIRAVIADPRIVDPSIPARDGKPRRFIDRGPTTLDDALRRLGTEARRHREPDTLVTGHVAVHGLGTASAQLLIEAKRQADAAGTVLNLHHAYAPEDVDESVAMFGADPLVRLAELGILGPNVTLAHANFLSDADLAVLVQRGVSVAWAPAAALLWATGGAFGGRHAEMWRLGGNVGLASDSGNWANDFDLFRQADLAMLISREIHHDRTYLQATDVLRMATRGGARACGRQEDIGSLKVGCRADLVIHHRDRPESHPGFDAVRSLMQAARSKSIRSVLVAGVEVLRDGVFVGIDEQAVLREADAAARALTDRMGFGADESGGRLARTLTGYL